MDTTMAKTKRVEYTHRKSSGASGAAQPSAKPSTGQQILDILLAQTDALVSLTETIGQTRRDNEVNLVAINRVVHQREKNLRLAKLRQMREKCEQEMVDICPCGKHKGIRFIDENKNNLGVYCPHMWWVSLSHLAFEEGRLSTFLTSTPLDKYIKGYRLTK
jgi:hypothetical protein